MKKKAAKARTSKKPEFQLSNECPNLDKHLCHVVALRNMKTAAQLSQGAAYICAICGRVAKKQINLCAPFAI